MDKEARTLAIADNGIGMDKDELVANLGTIARSGTAAFVKAMDESKRKDNPLIGQFGVGFYSAFMVADKVVVESRKAGTDTAWRWESDGKGSYAVSPAEQTARGTTILLHLKDDAAEFLDDERLGEIVRRYSDHIAIPIRLGDKTLNRASALWMRPKGDVTAEQHTEFYRHIAHAFDEPWANLHWRAEGTIEYSALLYVPGSRPFDLFSPERRHGVKLYVRRVFVNEAPEGLVPRYLRFLRGVVDSEDLPLNVSREMLQNNPVITKIRHGITGRVLGELEKRAKDDAEKLRDVFWDHFGEAIKEGIFEDAEHGKRVLGPRALPHEHAGQGLGESRGLRVAPEAGAGHDLLHRRRRPEGGGREPASRRIRQSAGSRCCCCPIPSTNSGWRRPTSSRARSSSR